MIIDLRPGFLSPSAGLKFADIPNGLAAIAKVPVAGWAQIAAYLALSSSAVASMITRLALLVTMASSLDFLRPWGENQEAFSRAGQWPTWPWWQSSACSFRRLAWWSDQPMSYHHSLPTLIKHMSIYVSMVVGAYRETSCGSWIRSDDFAGWSDRKRLGVTGPTTQHLLCVHSRMNSACRRPWVSGIRLDLPPTEAWRTSSDVAPPRSSMVAFRCWPPWDTSLQWLGFAEAAFKIV